MGNIVTYNTRLQMDQATLTYWTKLLTDTAAAYNLCVDIITEHKPDILTIKTVHTICYYKVRETFPELPAQSVIRVQKESLAAFRSRKSNKHNGSNPHKRSLSMTLDKRLYTRFTSDHISICGGTRGKRVDVPFQVYDRLTEMFVRYRACDPTIFLRNGEMWLSIPFEVPEPPVVNDEAIGVDLGIKRLFVTSDGVAFRDKTYLKHRRETRYLKSRLKSKGTKSARRHLKDLSRYERNLSKDMQYRAVNALLDSTDAGWIVMEDLSKIKKATSRGSHGRKRKRHNSQMSQVPFYEFKMKLEAKAHLRGREVKTVHPAYTSQTDSRTGERDGTRKGCRYYCSDGVVLDADWNAALNISRKGNHPSSNPLPVDGGIVFLDGRAPSTAQSYVNPHRAGARCGIASPLIFS